MKMLRSGIFIYVSLLLSGCLYGQCMDGPCSLERERIIKSIKPYGEYWIKSGMTAKSWRQDWVACGGWSNGQYGAYTPPGASDADSSVLWEQVRKKLDACMKSKGYEYRYTESR